MSDNTVPTCPEVPFPRPKNQEEVAQNAEALKMVGSDYFELMKMLDTLSFKVSDCLKTLAPATQSNPNAPRLAKLQEMLRNTHGEIAALRWALGD